VVVGHFAGEPMTGVVATAPHNGLTVASAAGRWVLAATILGSALAGIDATVVGIALPAIGRDFHVGIGSLQWVVTGYTLTLSGLLLVAGALGDRRGRRRIFVIGVVWFALSSALCGLAPNSAALIGGRALQGVGAALLTPGSLAILQASFAPEERGRAIGAWSGLSGVALAVGPFLGGWLIDVVSWRLIFTINVPLAVIVLVITSRYVPETREVGESGAGVDYAGGALVSVGLLGVVFGLIEGSSLGWTSPQVLASLLIGVAVLAVFLVHEKRTANPMLPLEMFRSRQFTATNAVTFVVYGALGGALFLLPVQLQQVVHYSPVAAGTALIPVTVIMLALSARSGALAARIGPRLQMTVGPLVIAAGLAYLSTIGPGATYATDILPPIVLFGLGLAIVVAPLTSVAMSSAPGENAGVASAVNNDVARTAGLVAVAVLPAVAGLTGGAYLHPAEFNRGYHLAVLITAGVCATGGLLAAFFIRNRPSIRASHTYCALDAPALECHGTKARARDTGSEAGRRARSEDLPTPHR
jgi:EmrB/QacA subfamily drug resistance transporter